MFGIGWTEFIVIAVVLLVVVGPKRLPALFRKLGRLTAEFRTASRELRNQIEIEADDLQSPSKIVRDLKRDVWKKVSEPYAELAEEDRRLRQELEQAADTGERPTDQPSATSATAESIAAEPESIAVQTESIAAQTESIAAQTESIAAETEPAGPDTENRS